MACCAIAVEETVSCVHAAVNLLSNRGRPTQRSSSVESGRRLTNVIVQCGASDVTTENGRFFKIKSGLSEIYGSS